MGALALKIVDLDHHGLKKALVVGIIGSQVADLDHHWAQDGSDHERYKPPSSGPGPSWAEDGSDRGRYRPPIGI